jgi:hypothetical protein
MTDRNEQDNQGKNVHSGDFVNQGRGKQGADKAPGEERAQATENSVFNTQKGKNKVDGDPSKEEDQPVEQQ